MSLSGGALGLRTFSSMMGAMIQRTCSSLLGARIQRTCSSLMGAMIQIESFIVGDVGHVVAKLVPLEGLLVGDPTEKTEEPLIHKNTCQLVGFNVYKYKYGSYADKSKNT